MCLEGPGQSGAREEASGVSRMAGSRLLFVCALESIPTPKCSRGRGMQITVACRRTTEGRVGVARRRVGGVSVVLPVVCRCRSAWHGLAWLVISRCVYVLLVLTVYARGVSAALLFQCPGSSTGQVFCCSRRGCCLLCVCYSLLASLAACAAHAHRNILYAPLPVSSTTGYPSSSRKASSWLWSASPLGGGCSPTRTLPTSAPWLR